MSRIGKLPVNLPAGVTVTVSPDNVVSVKGPLGTLSQKVDSDITVTVEGNEVHVTRPTDQPRHRSMHGLYRSLIHNMVVGVSEGYQIQQELVGVGYKAEMQGSVLQMSLGYSHDIYFEMPKEITATAVTEKKSNPIVTLKSIDKQLIGQVAAKIRSLRKPEPYKGKGIKFVGEQLRRKAGNLPAGVTVTVSPDNVVSVKGPLGTLSQKVDSDITVTVEGNEVHVTRPTDQPRHRSMHGLYRSLIHNMVVGVSEGYQIQQELVGVGYKAEMQGSVLQMSLGYSHDIYFEMPKEITATAVTEKKSNPIVTLKSIDKQLIGQVAAKIRSLRKPEPYKGKGIKFVGEQLRRKAGKSANAK